MSRARWLLALVLLLIPAALPAQNDSARWLPPDALLRPETILGTLVNLEIERELVRRSMVKDADRMGDWRARRDQTLTALRTLYQELDARLDGGGDDETAPGSNLERRITNTTSRLETLVDEGLHLVERMAGQRDRLAALEEKTRELGALLPEDRDSLTGIWDARFDPTSERGVLTLYQNGTLLTGQYVLDGGWHGSVQGTVVDGRVFLERIDSRKGRFADMSGDLDSSGTSIRGRWTERDLTANRPVEGNWIARKRRGNGS